MTEVAQLVAKEAITPAQGNAIAALARAAAKQKPTKAPEAKSVIVEVARFSGNGHSQERA